MPAPGHEKQQGQAGKDFFWPWPNSVIPMKSNPGLASHKDFWGRETHKTFQFVLLGIDLQEQRICSSKVAVAIVKENRFLQNVRNSRIFEQIFLPALMLIFPCQVFSKQNC